MEGQLLGTPNYMAPEQIQGREVDHRADIFSLGVVFYEALTRKKPFQGENMTAVTHKIVYDAFQPPEEIVRDLPKGLSAVLTRCLEKDPNRRFPRASEVARDIRGVIAAQQALDDTVATQEVEELAEAGSGAAAPPTVTAAITAPLATGTPPPPAVEPASPAPVAAAPPPAAPAPAAPPPPVEAAPAPAVDPTALPTAEFATPSDVLPTRILERPPVVAPPAPAPAPGAADASVLADNAPTALLERPPIQEFRATLASPPKPVPEIPPPPAPAPASEPPPAPAPPPPEPPPVAAPPAAGTAATVLSAVPRTTKSAPPPAAQPVPAAAGAPAKAAPAAPKARRSLWVAAAALVLFGLAGGAVLWQMRTPERPAAPVEAAPVPAPEQQVRVTAAAAISEARTHLAAGSLDAALQAVARAELAEPQNPEIAALREEIDARRQEIEESARQTKIEEGLRAARYAYAERRYSDAISAARAVLSIDNANEEARRLIGEADRAAKRLRERQAAIEAAQQPPPAAEPEPAPQPAEPAIDPALLNEATLRIEFASERSEGVLTIYAGERQVLREPFKFVRRTGFLAREKTSGTILATRKVTPGDVPVKVYIALPGKATRAILLDGHFPGGKTQTLVIRVDADGNATAAFS
jgi:hypothetical protein